MNSKLEVRNVTIKRPDASSTGGRLAAPGEFALVGRKASRGGQIGEVATRVVALDGHMQAVRNIAGCPQGKPLEGRLLRAAFDTEHDKLIALGHIVKDDWVLADFEKNGWVRTMEWLRANLPSYELEAFRQINVFLRNHKLSFSFTDDGLVKQELLELEFESAYQTIKSVCFSSQSLGGLCAAVGVSDTSKLKNRIVQLHEASDCRLCVWDILRNGCQHEVGRVVSTKGTIPSVLARG